MVKDLWDLFIAFTRASNLGFGGGPAVVPLIQAEAVDKYKWMNNEEYADALAISNALPGPIATKMAAYVGYRVAGWPGAFSALLGTIGPMVLVVVLLGNLIMTYSQSPALQAMLQAVRPVVVVLIAHTAYEMGRKSFPDLSTWLIALVTVGIIVLTSLHPAFIIVASMLLGYAVWGKKRSK
ncbi:MAG TPA: chromate transporter [Peptococcaceae bacterium]|nr:chromate transporter [Peptococcaceae bacterium]